MLPSSGGVSGGVAWEVVKDKLGDPLLGLTLTSTLRFTPVGNASVFVSAMFGVLERKVFIVAES